MISIRTPGRRRWPALVTGLLTVSAVALSGCSSSPDGDSGDTGDTDKSTAEAPAEPVSIDYWHRLPAIEGAKSLEEIVEDWNADNPDIQVKATALQGSAGDSYPKIAAAVEAGTAPCLAQVGNDRVPDLLSKGQLLDVTEHAAQYEDSYLDFAWARSTFDGHTFGIPQDTGPIVLYYRTDLFEEYDIEAPTTWEDFREAGEKIQEQNSDAYISSFLPDESMWITALASANGADWWTIEGDAWKVNIDTEESMQVAEYWQGLIDDGIVETLPRWDPNFDKALSDGTLVGTIGASWEAPLIQGSAPDTAGNWGVAQLAAFEGKDPGVGEDGGSIVAVLEGCEAPAQAVEFADWLNTNVDDLMPLGLFPATQAPAEGYTTPADLQEFYGGQDIYAEFSTANANTNAGWSFSPTAGVTLTTLADGMGQVVEGNTQLPDLIKEVEEDSIESLQDAGISVAE